MSHVKTQNPVWLDSREKTRKGKKIGSTDLWDKFRFLAAAGWGVSGGGGGRGGGEAQREMQSGEGAKRLEEMVEIRVRRTRGGRERRREKL